MHTEDANYYICAQWQHWAQICTLAEVWFGWQRWMAPREISEWVLQLFGASLPCLCCWAVSRVQPRAPSPHMAWNGCTVTSRSPVSSLSSPASRDSKQVNCGLMPWMVCTQLHRTHRYTYKHMHHKEICSVGAGRYCWNQYLNINNNILPILMYSISLDCVPLFHFTSDKLFTCVEQKLCSPILFVF